MDCFPSWEEVCRNKSVEEWREKARGSANVPARSLWCLSYKHLLLWISLGTCSSRCVWPSSAFRQHWFVFGVGLSRLPAWRVRSSCLVNVKIEAGLEWFRQPSSSWLFKKLQSQRGRIKQVIIWKEVEHEMDYIFFSFFVIFPARGQKVKSACLIKTRVTPESPTASI